MGGLHKQFARIRVHSRLTNRQAERLPYNGRAGLSIKSKSKSKSKSMIRSSESVKICVHLWLKTNKGHAGKCMTKFLAPCGGITRIRFKGSVATRHSQPCGSPALYIYTQDRTWAGRGQTQFRFLLLLLLILLLGILLNDEIRLPKLETMSNVECRNLLQTRRQHSAQPPPRTHSQLTRLHCTALPCTGKLTASPTAPGRSVNGRYRFVVTVVTL